MPSTLTRPTTNRPRVAPLAPSVRPLPPIDDVTRRGLLKGAAALLVVTACGTDRQPVAAPSPTATTRTIEHKYGTTEISGVPERVVSVGLIDQDALLALGVVPVATRTWFGERPGNIFPWAQDALGDAPPPEALAFELDFEKIAGLQPDVIVGLYSGLTEQEYGLLSQIAPTVAQPGEYIDYGMPWQELTQVTGRILGREARAEELVAQVDARFAAAREEHPEFVGTTLALSTVPNEDGNFFFYTSQDARARVFTSLGFGVPDELEEIAGEEFYGEISAERLDLFDTADVLVWLTRADGRREIRGHPLVPQLDAMREGSAVFVEDELLNALEFTSVLSLPSLLDQLVPMMAAAVDGDAATPPTPTSS